MKLEYNALRGTEKDFTCGECCASSSSKTSSLSRTLEAAGGGGGGRDDDVKNYTLRRK